MHIRSNIMAVTNLLAIILKKKGIQQFLDMMLKIMNE